MADAETEEEEEWDDNDDDDDEEETLTPRHPARIFSRYCCCTPSGTEPIILFSRATRSSESKKDLVFLPRQLKQK